MSMPDKIMTDIDKLPQAIQPHHCPYVLRPVQLDDATLLQKSLWRDRSNTDVVDFVERVLKFKHHKRGIGIVVTDEANIVAYGQTTLWMQCAEISDLFVTPDYRSHGIGTAMIQYLTQYAIQRKIDCVELGVAESNPRALKLYRQLGFTESYTLELDLGSGRESVIYLTLDVAPYH